MSLGLVRGKLEKDNFAETYNVVVPCMACYDSMCGAATLMDPRPIENLRRPQYKPFKENMPSWQLQVLLFLMKTHSWISCSSRGTERVRRGCSPINIWKHVDGVYRKKRKRKLNSNNHMHPQPGCRLR